MKIITYNVWHGLNGSGFFKFGELEPRGRKEERIRWQLEQLKKLDPDVLFLQEMNPIGELSKRYALALNMDYVWQIDQSGMKVLGRGFPWNLQSGLAILAKKHLNLEKVEGLKLSGPIGFNNRLASFQFAEFRYALVAGFNMDGKTWGLVNVHLHHGPQMTEGLSVALESLTKKRAISLSQEISVRSQISQGENRRSEELGFLLDWMKTDSLDHWVLGGDFNLSPDASELKEINKFGLVDSASLAGSEEPLLTWNAPFNVTNHGYTKHLKLPVSHFQSEELLNLLRDHDARPRRLDYLWIDKDLQKNMKSVRLVLNNEVHKLFGSDHFGLELNVDN